MAKGWPVRRRTRSLGLNRRKRSGIVVLIAVAALVVPAIAVATTSNYWGYNNISNTNPAAGACYYNTSTSGIACANTMADSATVEKAGGDSGDYVINTFRNGNGDIFNGNIVDTVSALSATGHDPAEGPTCYHDFAQSSHSYIQCRYTLSGGT